MNKNFDHDVDCTLGDWGLCYTKTLTIDYAGDLDYVAKWVVSYLECFCFAPKVHVLTWKHLISYRQFKIYFSSIHRLLKVSVCMQCKHWTSIIWIVSEKYDNSCYDKSISGWPSRLWASTRNGRSYLHQTQIHIYWISTFIKNCDSTCIWVLVCAVSNVFLVLISRHLLQ